MYLIVGLGNPGLAYRKSRHNAGFLALDALAKRMGIRLYKRAHRSILGEGKNAGEKLILAKPQTFMNKSGEAVQALMRYYRLDAQRLIVLYDDIDLPVGQLRIRANGSAGTHNGMRSIIAALSGEQGFPRVRIGVGRQQDERDLAAHVLSKPGKDELPILEAAYKNAAEAVVMICEGKIGEAQARYNSKS